MKVLILLNFPEAVRNQYREGLAHEFPELDIELVDHHFKAAAPIREAEVLITFGAHLSDDVFRGARKLRWVQALGTGVDGILDSPNLPAGVMVTNLRGLQGDSVSEAVLAAMLALARKLARSIRNQGEARWERFPVTLLKGSVVGILGVGVIAEELAPKCKALGMRVIGISGSRREVAGFDEIRERSQLQTAVADLDHLVLLAPFTEETRGIVSEAVLARLKPTAFLVNVARGGLVDEGALIRRLQEGRLGGAALDVFADEPLPPEHPFWSLPNVIVTPHMAGFHTGYAAAALPVVAANLRHFLAGRFDEMVDVVRPGSL